MAIISRLTRRDIPKLCNLLKKRNYYVEVGVKSTTLLVSSSEYIEKKSSPKIGILSAGTSDIGVAEEARLIAKAMGCSAVVNYDVGIAGIHRLFPALQQMISETVNALVVVAGMEGALASVVSFLSRHSCGRGTHLCRLRLWLWRTGSPCIHVAELYRWFSCS